MRRWLPHPLMAASILAAWLVLRQSLTPGTVLVGLVLAWLLSRLWARLEPPAVHLRRAGLLLALGMRVFVDIVASNWAVARLIVMRRPHASGFVAIPLKLTHPPALAMLATIVTATPGTIWVSHDSRRHRLLIHILDTASEAVLVHNIKQRYEPPLLEIFR